MCALCVVVVVVCMCFNYSVFPKDSHFRILDKCVNVCKFIYTLDSRLFTIISLECNCDIFRFHYSK